MEYYIDFDTNILPFHPSVMEIVYTVDLKIPNDGIQLKDTLTTDVSCLNILAFSCSYLPVLNQLKYNPYHEHQVDKSSFCVYLCALEQPWYFHLIATSIVPFVQLVWSLDGTHLLACNQTGLCQVFQMKNGCMNTMENLYQYEIKEDILHAKYVFPMEPVIVNLNRNESIYYEREQHRSPWLQYALRSGNFICVTSSGTIYTLPLNRSLSPFSYSLSPNGPLCASLCDIYPIDKGFSVILGEQTPGALIHFFVVHCSSAEPKLSYVSCRASGFRIPSCYGDLQSLKYFQRNGIDCVLTYMKSFSGDLIDLYEFKGEWISTTLLNSPQAGVTTISLSTNQLVIDDQDYQGLFGRQILVALNDGSIVYFDKLNLKAQQMEKFNFNQPDFFLQIKHTYSGSCCAGFTQTGLLVLLRCLSLDRISSLPSMVNILVHLFEQYIVQMPCPCDIWDVLCLIPHSSILNELIDRLVFNFDVQSLEFKRRYFTRFKECLFHLHRLACPLTNESCEHLTSLILYYILLIVRDHLRLYIYEPSNRNFVDAAQEILDQPSFMQNIDIKRIKYLGDLSNPIDQFQLISFTRLIDWITDILFRWIGCLQLQKISRGEQFFTDINQLQWLRELIIYCYILHQMEKIPHCKIANVNGEKHLLKDIYHSLTKFSHRIEMQKNNVFTENFLEEFSVLDVEMLQSKSEAMFPKFYRFLRPNSSSSPSFIRDQTPFDQTFDDIQFDLITIGKMSLSANSTYRRCLRCSNFSRVFTSEPYPLLVNRLNHRCLCGGLFVRYTQSNAVR